MLYSLPSATISNEIIINKQSDFTLTTSIDNFVSIHNGICSDPAFGFAENEIVIHNDFNSITLSNGAKRVLFDPNAGGKSELSESMSFEVLKRLLGVELVKTEMELNYAGGATSKKTDYSCSFMDKCIGVSVTRAMKYNKKKFTYHDAKQLLTKKLYGVVISSENIFPCDKWHKQILHIFVREKYMCDIIHNVYNDFLKSTDKSTQELISNTVVICSFTIKAGFIYSNKSVYTSRDDLSWE